MVEGSQQARAVDLLFTEEAVFYATDAPHDPNYIYRYDRETGQTEQLQQVGGPVFYGRKTGGRLFFSTVAEPSDINRTDAVELWRSGNEGDSWRKLKEFQKDIGHMKLFQYGQLKFPNGPGDGEYIWFTRYATKGDHRIMRIPLDECGWIAEFTLKRTEATENYMYCGLGVSSEHALLAKATEGQYEFIMLRNFLEKNAFGNF